jgi:hypothetical protein
MRHGRLVATGLATGAVLGFLGELLRHRPAAPEPAVRVDLTEQRPSAPASLVDVRVGPVRSPRGTPYTDAVTLAMAARGMATDRLAVATDGEVHG